MTFEPQSRMTATRVIGSRPRMAIAERELVYFDLGNGRDQRFDIVSDLKETRDLSQRESMKRTVSHFRESHPDH